MTPPSETPNADAPRAASPRRPRTRLRRILRRIFASLGAALLGAVLGIVGLWLFRPFPEECLRRPPPQSILLTDRNGEPLRVFLGEDGTFSLWEPIDAFGEWLPNALIAAEDKRFRSHCGIDPLALLRAIRQNTTNLRRISGASTISTQVIRLAQPRPRVMSTKVAELFLATQMERCHTKDEILEQYLNRAPFGGNFIGAEAAARRYFGKRARDLSLAEAALLAGLPQSPTRHRPDIHPESALKRRAYVLSRMLDLGYIDEAQYTEALDAPLPNRLLPLPFEAPHFCNAVLRLTGPAMPRGEVRTTLDLDLQRSVETALREHIASLHGIHGGAVLVLDTGTREVLAWAGSPDFRDNAHAGQFDVLLAWRSPGSALKPFAYALALEQGRITPATALPDLPRQYVDFAPGNFDGSHRGIVSAQNALVLSLNAPALNLVARCGTDAFLDALEAFGIEAMPERSRKRNGLGAVIGNSEVRPIDLVSAYARLAGRVLDPPDAPSPLPVSPAAAWIVLDMISGDERVAVETGLSENAARRRTAWKTGTSAGFRDAWTVAVTPSYTLGVWLGNPDGRPSPDLVGIEAAAPLAFRILGDLPPRRDAPEWFERPAQVESRQVCAASGLRPGPYCTIHTDTWAISNVTAQTVCNVHRPDADGDGRPEELWPPEIQAFRTASSARGTVSSKPVILVPAPNAVLHAAPVDAGGGTLPLRARGTGRLWWFLDGEFIGEAPATEPILWTPTPGRHVLRCCNADGAHSEISFEYLDADSRQ